MGTYLFKNLAAIYKEARVYLKYLSFYLLNYNLIEESFSTLKV